MFRTIYYSTFTVDYTPSIFRYARYNFKREFKIRAHKKKRIFRSLKLVSDTFYNFVIFLYIYKYWNYFIQYIVRVTIEHVHFIIFYIYLFCFEYTYTCSITSINYITKCQI